MDIEDILEDPLVYANQTIIERNVTFNEVTKEWKWSSPKTVSYKQDKYDTLGILKELIQSSEADFQRESTSRKGQNGRVPLPINIKQENISENLRILGQLLESGDLHVEQISSLRPMPKPIVYIDSVKNDSGFESVASSSTNGDFEGRPPLKVMQFYLVPNKNNKRWVEAKLVHIEGDDLHLVEGKMFNNITTTTKRIAYSQPPTKLLRVGTRVIALRKDTASTGEVLRGHARHEMGVVAEFPTDRNAHRYLVMFDNSDWLYVKPSDVWQCCHQSQYAWDDVPETNKRVVRNFVHGLYQSVVTFEVGDEVVYEVSPDVVKQGVVIKVDASILYIFFYKITKCIVLYKGLPNFKIR